MLYLLAGDVIIYKYCCTSVQYDSAAGRCERKGVAIVIIAVKFRQTADQQRNK